MTIKMVGIVDDDDDVRTSIESLLRSAGYQPLGFADAESFLASTGCGMVDCLLTDYHMPGLSGLDLQREIGRLRPTLPVIMMTAFPTDRVREEALKQGIADFLVKPINGDLLITRLEEVIC